MQEKPLYCRRMYKNGKEESGIMFVGTGAIPFFMGADGKEAVVRLESTYMLVFKNGADVLGYSKKDAIEKLKSLDKIKNFPEIEL